MPSLVVWYSTVQRPSPSANPLTSAKTWFKLNQTTTKLQQKSKQQLQKYVNRQRIGLNLK